MNQKTKSQDWQKKNHLHFSHHNHLHSSFAPRTLREAFGDEQLDPVELISSGDKAVISVTLILLAVLLGSVLLGAFE